MAGLYSEKSQLEVTGEVNFNMSQSEVRSRIASILSHKQLNSAIDAEYKAIDELTEPEE
jgi:hypothetical protein